MRIPRWFLIPLIVFLFCLAFFLSSLAQEKLSAIVKKIEPSTVVILTYDEKGEILGQGSGFFISQNGDIITNWHVLQGASRAEVKTTQGKVYPITQIVAEDKEADIIRVSANIPPKEVAPLQVSVSIPEAGEPVIVIGSPLGLERTVADGIVSAVRDIPEFGKIIQMTTPLSPGSSGSPVVNMKGEVIGVATFQMVEGQNLNFAIPSERVAKLIPAKGKTIAQWETSSAEEGLGSADSLYSTGLVFLWTEEYEKALPYFEKAVKKNPRRAEIHALIGYCYDKLGRITEAISAYKEAIRIQHDYALAYHNLGLAYDKLERYSEAIEAYTEAIRIEPDFAGTHYNLGVVYTKLGRYTESIEAYKLAIRIQPDFAPAHHNLGAAYHELGHYTEAISAFKNAIRIQPDFAEAHYGLALSYLMLKDRGSALDQYKILKDLDKDLANQLFNLIYK